MAENSGEVTGVVKVPLKGGKIADVSPSEDVLLNSSYHIKEETTDDVITGNVVLTLMVNADTYQIIHFEEYTVEMKCYEVFKRPPRKNVWHPLRGRSLASLQGS